MKRLIIVGSMILALAASMPARAETKLAYVDVQRALNECAAGKKARDQFRIQIERVQTKLQREQNEVAALKDELEKKGMLMKDDERRNLTDEYARKARDFDRNYKDTKDELERKDQEVTGAIVRDLSVVIRNIGEKRGYTMVVEKSSILWGAPGIDITDEVIRDYDHSGGRVSSRSEDDPEEAGAGTSFGQQAAKRSSISK
ncbi:MAG TPA: OmpH family outer membrane protein [Candidatus Binataceae bacterium]|nr:OmpH family outer membrane protein [Candidatus Binataceae bacterium]